VDPQLIELVRAAIAPGIATSAGLGFYLLYRKFEAERATSLREDNKTLRDENKDLREENRKLREELKGDDA
jgi:cell division protein FtsB